MYTWYQLLRAQPNVNPAGAALVMRCSEEFATSALMSFRKLVANKPSWAGLLCLDPDITAADAAWLMGCAKEHAELEMAVYASCVAKKPTWLQLVEKYPSIEAYAAASIMAVKVPVASERLGWARRVLFGRAKGQGRYTAENRQR